MANKDVDDALARPGPVKTGWTNVLTKCQAFWCKQRRSTVAQDVVKEKLGKVLPVPNATRWNSMYDAMKEVTWHYDDQRRVAIRSVCEKIKVDPLTVREVEFQVEYVKVSKLYLFAFVCLAGNMTVKRGFFVSDDETPGINP